MRRSLGLSNAVLCLSLLVGSAWANNTVFVTSPVHDGNLGGLSGADHICQTLADNSGLMGTYMAWLSAPGVDVGDRMTHSLVPYQLVNGTIIANNWTDLTDGTLSAPINRTESNTLVAAGGVWTGTGPDLTYNSSCLPAGSFSPWTGTSNRAMAGDTGQTSFAWTASGTAACAAALRLYCFQQDGGATAATVSITGRVTNAAGRVVRGARLRFTSSDGQIYKARSNQFGYYSVKDLAGGQTYVVELSAKGRTFAPTAISVGDSIVGLDFAMQ